MNLDAMRRHDLASTVDAVVIGTGAGGAPILARLAAANLSVVALEAGRNWTPDDFPADEVAATPIYWLGERLSGGAMPEAFGANNSGTGVGGATLHWGAFCPRPDPREHRLHTEFGVARDWPVDHAVLTGALAEVEAFIGVSGPASYTWDLNRRYPYPAIALNAPAHAMQRGCEVLGVRSSAAPVAAVSRPHVQPHHGPRRACINCGHCHQGCRNGAKTSMDVTYLPLAVAHGAEIRPQSTVHTIERDAAGRVAAVVYRDADGHDQRQRCRNLFVCAGGVETPRLLLHNGIGNASGQVGRNYMAHVATQVWGTFPTEMRCNKGYPSSLITEDMLRPTNADFVSGYLVQSLGVLPVTLFNQMARGRPLWGAALVDAIDSYNYYAGIGVNGDTLPSPDNFLELADEVDEIGMPRALIHFGYGENERRMNDHAVRFMTACWSAAGATDLWTCPRSAHTIGTCRMGTDPEDSVVDPHGRSHEIRNMFICDNSVFPSSMAANPALTNMALAHLFADTFLAAGG